MGLRDMGSAADDSRRLVYEPLDNGLDYLSSVVDHLSGEVADRDLKYAVLHLYAAIDVVIKARLLREHWALVVDRADRADRASYEAGDFQSVSATEGFDRLRRISGLPLSRRDRTRIEAAGRLRNRLQHFGLSVSTAEVTSIAAEALDFLLNFLSEHFLPAATGDDASKIRDAIDDVASDLGTIAGLVTARMQSIQSTLDGAAAVVYCPTCVQQALMLGEERATCAYCLSTFMPESAVWEHLWRTEGADKYTAAKEGGSYAVSACVDCGVEAMIFGVTVRSLGASEKWACFACGAVYSSDSVAECDRCGSLATTSSDDGTVVCADCWSDILSRD